MADRGATWQDSEIKALLEIWSSELIQRQLSTSYRNDAVFQAISDTLGRQGVRRTVKQCRDKIKALKKKYKDIVDKLRKSGVGVDSDEEIELWGDWKWFDPIHKLMRKRPSVNPVGLFDISTSTSSSRSETPTSLQSEEPSRPETEETDSEVVSGPGDNSLEISTPHSTISTPGTSISTSAPRPTSTTVSVATVTAIVATTSSNMESAITTTTSITTTATTTSASTRTTATPLSRNPSRKRKATKMEKAQRDVHASFEKLSKQQEDTKKMLVDLIKESVRNDEKAREEEKVQNDKFLELMSTMIARLQPPPAVPGPSYRLGPQAMPQASAHLPPGYNTWWQHMAPPPSPEQIPPSQGQIPPSGYNPWQQQMPPPVQIPPPEASSPPASLDSEFDADC